MNYEQMSNNKVNLTGIVLNEPKYSHHIYGEGFYETNILVRRLSEQSDTIPIIISERLIDEHSIEVNKKISISGQFRSYNKYDGEKSRLVLTVFVRDLIPVEEEKNPNTIDIVGFICKKPVYRTTPFNREIGDILVAVNRAYNKSDYIPCIAWGRNARFVKFLNVGDKIELGGRIQSREYMKTLEDGTTEKRIAYEVSINKICLSKDELTLNQTEQKEDVSEIM